MNSIDDYEFPIAESVTLLCGATAHFDYGSGIGYRCDDCGAVVHSVGMPRECKELYEMREVVERLKGGPKTYGY